MCALLVQELRRRGDVRGIATLLALNVGFSFIVANAVSYTHLDVYKRQSRASVCARGGPTTWRAASPSGSGSPNSASVRLSLIHI